MILLTFANSPEGYKLTFLLNHEVTRYQFTSNICDLTYGQTYFLYLIAEKQQAAINEELHKSNPTTQSPLTITDRDDPKTVLEKMHTIKHDIWGMKDDN